MFLAKSHCQKTVNFLQKNKTILLLSLLCLLATGYSFNEWFSYRLAPNESEINVLAEESVSTASKNLQQFIFDFTNQSTLFTEFAKNGIEEKRSIESISKIIENDFNFWGTAIYKDKNRVLWNGFVPDEYPDGLLSNDKSLHVSIESDNNITYLFSIIPFFIQQDTSVIRYDVYTRSKISQENILSLGSNLEQDPRELFTNLDQYPVNFSFSERIDQEVLSSSIISTVSSDSLGQIYALSSDYDTFKNINSERIKIWKALFFACFLILIGLLMFSFSRGIGGWVGLLIQVLTFTSIWILIRTLYPLFEIQSNSFPLLSNLLLIEYILNSMYIFLISYSISRYLIDLKDISNTQFIALVAVFLNGFLVLTTFYFLSSTSTVIIKSSVVVLDLELLPEFTTLLFYLSSSISFVSLLVLNTTISWFIFRNSSNKIWILLTSLLLTFITVAWLISISFEIEKWVFAISTLFFLITIVFALFLLKRTPAFIYSSKLRLLIFVSYLSVCFIYIAYASGTSIRQNQQMYKAAESFSVDEENEMQIITTDLLKDLSADFSSLSTQAFDDSFFDQYLQNYIKPEWLRYTISVQIIDDDGDRFSDYTTSLSAPQWSTAFRVQELEIPYEDERIRRDNIRPILRSRPINTINANYSAFIRGWIPIFESTDSDVRIGWILCSVYEELPQLNRPLRTVISSNENTFIGETLTSTEYQNGTYVRSSIEGTPLEIPGPFVLSQNIIRKVETDSIFSTSFNYNNAEIKELYVKKADDVIVRIATRKVAFTQHVFSFLRLFFILIILGICIMIMLSGNRNWRVFGYSRRFKDRLIDRFILASIVCLLALVGTSYYVLNLQNSEDVQSLLFDRLDNLVTNLESFTSNTATNPSELQKLTTILDVDAAIYQDGLLVNSTTSQIFAQHLLPKSLPWDVYNRIITNESNQELSIVAFDNQEMVIGYKPWLNERNEIAGIAAVPTFLKAPKFYDRLLSTTSLLLAFYTLIFGLLMMVIGFISTQLTSPLEAIQGALQRISDGDLNVTLPVRSDDEIGTLTTSYNNMAKRLKTVQLELAKNEREEAWKEMAQQIAHEIKNPLTPMKLNLQHLERQLENSGDDINQVKPKVAKITASMIEQIDALNKIASDFSNFAKPIEHEFQLIDLNKLVHSVTEMYKSDDNYIVKADLIKEPLFIKGAKDELRRVLVNLIKNAIEALPKEGKINVTSFSDHKNKNAFVTITDNGEGISSENQKKIFVPNFSTKSSGTGLGLAITKKIIEQHDGEITFISTIGEGTSFTISLPRSKKQPK